MAQLGIDKSRTALLSMDFFVGAAANPMVQQRGTLEVARTVLDAARAAGIPVVHIVIGFREGYAEVSDRNKLFGGMIKKNGVLKAGSEMVQIHEQVAPLLGELVVSRPRINALYNSELNSVLAAANVDTLVLMGVSTNLVVEGTARAAADADYRVIVLEDCCASHGGPDAHDFTVKNILPMIVDVASSADFLESLG